MEPETGSPSTRTRLAPVDGPADDGALARLQIAFLFIVSVAILLAAPADFNFQPDTGFYVGGAQSILEDGSYWFAGQPILIYYPGMSVLLTIPIAVFGLDFQVLHLFSAGFAVVALWLVRTYLTTETQQIAGLLAPVLLVFTGVFQEQVIYILSDAPFLALSFGALILWRRYEKTDHKGMLFACAALVAFAPMLRFQGLFVVAAFSLALAIRWFDRQAPGRWLVGVGLLSTLVALPFLLWTLRNYLQYTPDAYNMANAFFFGQKGLPLYSGEFHKVDWIDADWKYGVYNLLYTVRNLGITIFGEPVEAWIRLELFPVLLAIPLLAGLRPWWQNATSMERAYVLLSLAFIVFYAARANSLYTVPRYWLPMLPFVLLIGSHGLVVLYRWLARPLTAAWLQAVMVSLVLLVVGHGTVALAKQLQPWADNYYRESRNTVQQLARFVHKETPANATIAVTDWGVLPLFLERDTVSILNDSDRVRSLKRIVDRQASYLVILEGTSAMVEPAKAMVEALPDVFVASLVLDPPAGAGGGVYEINLAEASAELGRRTARPGNRAE